MGRCRGVQPDGRLNPSSRARRSALLPMSATNPGGLPRRLIFPLTVQNIRLTVEASRRLESEAMSDNRAQLSHKILHWIGQNALFTFGVVGSALMIFQGLEPFLKLSRFAVWIVEHWRGIVVTPWVWLGALVHIHVPTEVASAMTLCIFVATFAIRASTPNEDSIDVNDQSLTIILKVLTVPIFLIFAAFVIVKPQSFFGILLTLSLAIWVSSCIAMGFSIRNNGIEVMVYTVIVFGILSLLFVLANLSSQFWIIHYYISFLFTSIAGMALFLPRLAYGRDIFLTAVFSAAGARQAVRATMLVVALVCMNWIGLYAPTLKAWLDKVTALSP